MPATIALNNFTMGVVLFAYLKLFQQKM